MTEKNGVYISNDDLKNLRIIIDYLLKSEQKHYEEHIEDIDDSTFILSKEFYNRPDISHIYAMTRRLQDSLNSQ
jgi:hypothetical protein